MSGAQAPVAQGTYKPPIQSSFDQASSIIGSQLKQQKSFVSSVQEHVGALSSIRFGFVQPQIELGMKALQQANQNVAQLRDMSKAWNKWNTTAVPAGMSPGAYKKSLLGG